MLTWSTFKTAAGAFLQWLGAAFGFLVCLALANRLLPLPQSLVDAVPPSGFIPPLIAFLFNGAVNALILVWAARRSSTRGWALWAQLLVLSFGAQVFLTQIESAYFISAFPLAKNRSPTRYSRMQVGPRRPVSISIRLSC